MFCEAFLPSHGMPRASLRSSCPRPLGHLSLRSCPLPLRLFRSSSQGLLPSPVYTCSSAAVLLRWALFFPSCAWPGEHRPVLCTSTTSSPELGLMYATPDTTSPHGPLGETANLAVTGPPSKHVPPPVFLTSGKSITIQPRS